MVRKARSVRQGRLWNLSVPISAESEEAVTEILFELFGLRPSVYQDAETHVSTAHLYLAKKPEKTNLHELTQGLNRVRAAGLTVPQQPVMLKSIRQEDWAESWKRHFKPLLIRRRLLV